MAVLPVEAGHQYARTNRLSVVPDSGAVVHPHSLRTGCCENVGWPIRPDLGMLLNHQLDQGIRRRKTAVPREKILPVRPYDWITRLSQKRPTMRRVVADQPWSRV